MTTLGEYISGRVRVTGDGAATGSAAVATGVPTRRELNRIIDRYGWFTTARRARALITGEPDPALTLPLGFRPTIPPAIIAPTSVSEPAATPALGEADAVSSVTRESFDTLLDRFIEHGGYRISPSAEADSVDVEVDIDPEMVTEELAEIYRSQGLLSEAEKIYRILNLRNS